MKHKKILLAVFPFWTPIIPPLGLASLKSYVKKYNDNIRTVDLNIEPEFLNIHQSYIECLKRIIPSTNWGNINNIGNNIIKDHMLAFFKNDEESEYLYFQLIEEMILKSFFFKASKENVVDLNQIILKYFSILEDYVIELISKESPDILGMSVYSGTLGSSLFAARLVKEKFPATQIWVGGGIFSDHLNENSGEIQKFVNETPFIDKIIIGEGEMIFASLLINEDIIPQKKVYSIKDFSDKESLDLSTVEIPDFSDFIVSDYPYLTNYGSRSCPFQCSFCSETVYWGKFRTKPQGKLVDELSYLSEKYNSQLFLFGDSLLNPFITKLSQEMIKRQKSIYWDGYLRAEKAVGNFESALMWRKGGFYRARLGVESGSEKILKAMQKKLTPNDIRNAINSLANAGIKTTTYWIIGHPGETEEDFQMTLDLITELKDNIWEAECNSFSFFPHGQVHSEKFIDENSYSSLYDDKFSNLFFTKSYTLNTYPSREEIFERNCRFVKHCNQLNIPNPYTLNDINLADERWKLLHENSVPSTMDFLSKENFITENLSIGFKIFKAELDNNIDFSF